MFRFMKSFLSHRFSILSSRCPTQVTLQGGLGLTLCLLALTALGWLCQEVWEKETFRFDTAILLGLHQWANPFLDGLMLGLTRLANPEFVVVIVVVGLGWLLWQRQRQEAGMLAIACLGALLLNQGMKLAFARPRPSLWHPLIHETSYSFPSGHALGASVLYSFLAYLWAQRYPKNSRLIYSLAGIVIALIGLSRLYLGVHYPTDIIAGYIVGLSWLSICIGILKHNVHNAKLDPKA